jgi:hypothetical protein
MKHHLQKYGFFECSIFFVLAIFKQFSYPNIQNHKRRTHQEFNFGNLKELCFSFHPFYGFVPNNSQKSGANTYH